MRELLAGVADGPATSVQIVGEPGIGKSRLLKELCAQAETHGYRVLSGRASEFEADVPFALWRDALGPTLPDLGGARALEQLDEDCRHELASVLPALPSADGAHALTESTERYRRHRAFVALLEALAADAPLAVVLDDVHWADTASLEVIVHLVERPPAARVLLATAHRPSQMQPGLAQALGSVVQNGGERIELVPLSPQAAGALVPAGLTGDVRRQVLAGAGGNPFYLEQLVGAAQSGELRPESEAPTIGDGAVPSAVAASVARELATLSPAARAVIEGAAVAGVLFDAELATAAVDTGRAQQVASLDEVIAHDLVRPAETLGRFRFRHPIIQQAVYAQTRPAWRIDAHARVAEALAQRAAPAAARAAHVERFAQPGDSDAIAILEEAADKARMHTPLSAVRWYRAALALLPTGAEERRRDLLFGLARTLAVAGRLQEARGVSHQLLDAYDSSRVRPAVTTVAAMVEYLLGHHEQGDQLLLDQLGATPAESPEARALSIELAYGAFLAADWPAVETWAGKALEGDLADSPGRAAALSLLALAQCNLGRGLAAQQSAKAARNLVDGLSDPALLGRLESISMLGWAEFCLEDLDRSLAHATRAIQIAQEHGHGHLLATMQVVQALALMRKGASGRAADITEDAIDSARLSGNQLFVSWALTARCDAALSAGDLRGAVQTGEQAEQAARKNFGAWRATATPYLAEAYLQTGQPERCLETLLDARGAMRAPLPVAYYEPLCHETAALAHLAQQHVGDALAQADAAMDAGERIGRPGARAVGHRARAAVALASDDHGLAVELSEAAVALAEEAGMPVEAARCRLLLGRALSDGDPARAERELRRAYVALAGHNARRYSEAAAGELRALGARTPRPPAAAGRKGWAALSRREQEVAEAVAEGQTNREVATYLRLSEKTVANHLARIYKRLGLRSRIELATLVAGTRRR